MESQSSQKDSSDDHTKMSEGGLTPRGILNGTAFKSGGQKYAHPFYEAAASRGGFGFIATPSIPRASTPRMYDSFQADSETGQGKIKMSSKSVPYFTGGPVIPINQPVLPMSFDSNKPKSPSLNRIAQSDSNISSNPITITNKKSSNAPRKATTISVPPPRADNFIKKPPRTAPGKIGYSSSNNNNSDRSTKTQIPRTSWENEIVLAKYTTMNPSATKLEALSLEELEQKIEETVSQFTFDEQAPYSDISRRLERYIGKPSFGGRNGTTGKTSSASKISSQTSIKRSDFGRNSSAKSKSSKEVILHKSSSNSANRRVVTPPHFEEFIQTDIAKRMIKLLQGIGVGIDDERPKTPNTCRNELLDRLKKTYQVLQDELNGLKVNEEAFLKAKGLGSKATPGKITNANKKGFKMIGNRNNSTARLRSAPGKGNKSTSARGNTPALQELLDTIKGPRIPQRVTSNRQYNGPMSARTSGDDIRQQSQLTSKRPATTQSATISPFLAENFKLQEKMQWYQEYRSKALAKKPTGISTDTPTPRAATPKKKSSLQNLLKPGWN